MIEKERLLLFLDKMINNQMNEYNKAEKENLVATHGVTHWPWLTRDHVGALSDRISSH